MTASQVIAMRQHARDGMLIDDIARLYDLKVKATRRILQGRAWSWVNDPAGPGPVKYATTTNTKPHNKAIRPVCPHCSGFIEADGNDHQGSFLQCESCYRTWPALVTPQDRRRAAALSVTIQEEQAAQAHTGEAQEEAGLLTGV